MAWTTRTSTTAQTFGGTSLTPAAPSGLANNDILRLVVYIESAAAITWPAGFAEDVTQAAGDSSFWVRSAWKRASSESGSYGISWTGNAYADAILTAIAGATTSGNPNDATPTSSGNGSQTNTITVPSILTVTNVALLIAIGADFDVLSKTVPSGFTSLTDFNTLAIATAEQAIAGASGSKTYATTGTTQTVGAMIAYKPAAGASATAPPPPARRMPLAILAR
jgi:hypothetical protein